MKRGRGRRDEAELQSGVREWDEWDEWEVARSTGPATTKNRLGKLGTPTMRRTSPSTSRARVPMDARTPSDARVLPPDAANG